MLFRIELKNMDVTDVRVPVFARDFFHAYEIAVCMFGSLVLSVLLGAV